LLNVDFDFRTDSMGRDPDSASQTLKSYHLQLWQKPLPNGSMLKLSDAGKQYLLGKHDSGEIRLTSDAISTSLAGHRVMAPIIEQVPQELVAELKTLGSTIGSRILFPGDSVAGKRSINVARGFHPRIKDRFDLTLECIRLHYLGEASPLEELLKRYDSFFGLFVDFAGYNSFFLLEDLVSAGEVKFFSDVPDPLTHSPYPKTREEYIEYAERTLAFLRARNLRIGAWLAEQE